MQDEERHVDLTWMTSDGAFWSEAVMAACLEWLMERKVQRTRKQTAGMHPARVYEPCIFLGTVDDLSVCILEFST